MDTREITNIKNVSDVQRVMNANQVVWQGGIPLKDLPIGAKVVDPNTKYYDKPIVWIIADKNHEGYPANTVTLISEKILCLKCFSAQEYGNNVYRQKYGSNRYKYSNLLQWLNSEKSNWYSPQSYYDQPPKSSNVFNDENPYDTEPGFLNNFSEVFKGSIVSTNLKTAVPTGDGGGSENVTSKIFLASSTEVGLANENKIDEGTKLPIFSSDYSRNAYPTNEAVNKSDYKSLYASNPWWWWLRTPNAVYSYYVRLVNTSGALGSDYAYYGRYGVRPLCNVKDDSSFFEVIK
ncbi:DUF6273 domain-containing protein [Peptoniphilus duerdenii]|uniref:DUF6273 domain-containing protein n=1 Tax=Peptoniphilus duerdenii TaxID=507750 RepID=UPI0023F510C8|nr:DUF6273 domain-containing protein [Peptoniphilus duerdenii]